ncbi:MAG: hypothetical protein DME26_17745 [Verrucomicrobia bacterium]|nr:MAG: hypothetical protein DME26_17745 [Verrucomicrobiota bacterium]
MPNLTSVDRLARFYEDDRNYFVMRYGATGHRPHRNARLNFSAINFPRIKAAESGAKDTRTPDASRLQASPNFAKRLDCGAFTAAFPWARVGSHFASSEERASSRAGSSVASLGATHRVAHQRRAE